MHKKEENMALNSNQITVWKDKHNIKTIGTGSVKNESDQYTNFSLSEVYTKDGKMLGLGLNMQVAGLTHPKTHPEMDALLQVINVI